MNKVLLKEKAKASFLHFVVSLVIILLYYYLVSHVWYPFPYDYFYNPEKVAFNVFIVDVVLGPTLTFVLYNSRKKTKELIVDIGSVLLIQLTALVMGVYITYVSRPVFLVFSDSTFYTFSSEEVNIDQLRKKELVPRFWTSPQVVYIDPPKSSAELTQLYKEYLLEGASQIQLRAERYLPLSEGFHSITEYSINIDKVLIKHPEYAGLLKAFIDGRDNQQLSDFYFYPVVSVTGKEVVTVAFNKHSQKIEGLVESSLGYVKK